MKKVGLFALVLGVGFLIAQVPFPGGSSGGGSGSGAYSQITKTVLASPATNITFSSISGNFNNLEIKCQLASSVAATQDAVNMQVNGDTATNYNFQQLTANNATVSASVGVATANATIGAVAGSTAPANAAGTIDIVIPNYAGTTFLKDATSASGWKQADAAASIFYSAFWWNWKSTAAITSIKIYPNTGPNFVTGSVCTLYGIQ